MLVYTYNINNAPCVAWMHVRKRGFNSAYACVLCRLLCCTFALAHLRLVSTVSRKGKEKS